METEADRAAFYEQHQDDDDLWGAPEPAPTAGRAPRANLTATITVRFSATEAATIRQIAREQGVRYSDVVREAVAAYTRRNPQTTSVVRLFSAEGERPRSEGTKGAFHRADEHAINATGTR